MFEIKALDLPHSIPFREASGGDFAHEAALQAGKANALISLDVLMNEKFAAQMKAEFVTAMKEAGRYTNGYTNGHANGHTNGKA